MKRGLGRGLDSLFGDFEEENQEDLEKWSLEIKKIIL